MESLHGVTFAAGRSEHVDHVAFTHEPLAFVHRVLFYYVFMKALQLCGGELHRYHTYSGEPHRHHTHHS
jgi:hypothetical protein